MKISEEKKAAEIVELRAAIVKAWKLLSEKEMIVVLASAIEEIAKQFEERGH